MLANSIFAALPMTLKKFEMIFLIIHVYLISFFYFFIFRKKLKSYLFAKEHFRDFSHAYIGFIYGSAPL